MFTFVCLIVIFELIIHMSRNNKLSKLWQTPSLFLSTTIRSRSSFSDIVTEWDSNLLLGILANVHMVLMLHHCDRHSVKGLFPLGEIKRIDVLVERLQSGRIEINKYFLQYIYNLLYSNFLHIITEVLILVKVITVRIDIKKEVICSKISISLLRRRIVSKHFLKKNSSGRRKGRRGNCIVDLRAFVR